MIETRFLLHRGNRIAYTLTGRPAGPPVILVHGWLSCKETWRQTLPFLETHYRVAALDLLGHGESDKPEEGYAIPDQAGRVLALANHLGFDRFNLIGHSMGGMIALLLAAEIAWDRVERLVNVDGILYPQFSPALHLLIRRLRRLPETVRAGLEAAREAVRDRHLRDAMLKHILFRPEDRPPDYDEIDLAAALQPGMEKALVLAADAIMRMDIRPLLSHVGCPALTVFGENDPLVPVSQAYEVAAHVRDHRLLIIPDCGHVPMHEKPQAYLAGVRDFLLPGDSTGVPADIPGQKTARP